ncbi:MAG: PAS domain S-box protein, partial [Candidatus Binatia bacterium]
MNRKRLERTARSSVDSPRARRSKPVPGQIVESNPTEDRLRESEERYRRIVETANEGIWVIDERGITTFVNRKVGEMLGYAESEVIGRSIFDFIHPEELLAGQAHLELLLAGKRVQTDFKVHHRDGTAVWLLVSANPLFDRDGRYAGALGMITDITERKEAEEATQRYTERLNLLRQVEQGILRAETSEAVAEVVLEHLQKLFPVQRASIALFDYQTYEIYEIATYSDRARVPGTREPFSAYGSAMNNMDVLRQGEIFVVETLHYAKESPVIRDAHERGVRYVTNVPLLAGGELIGSLCLGTSAPHSLPAEVLDIAREMAGPLAIAIRQAQLLDAERRRSEQFSRSNRLVTALGRVAARLQASLDPGQVMETLGGELKRLNLDYSVAFHDPEEGVFVLRYASIDLSALERLEDTVGGLPDRAFRLPREQLPVYDRVLERREPFFVHDVLSLALGSLAHLSDPIREQVMKSLRLSPASHAILLPLAVEERVAGVLGIVGSDLEAADVPAFSVLASQVAVALENARLFEELRVAQGRLKTLSRRLVEAHETERRTLARELHDEIGQILTALKLTLETCLRTAADGTRAQL